MNDLVYAQLVQLGANAQLRVERLQAKQRMTPNVVRTSDSRLALFRQLTEAQDQAASWRDVVAAAIGLVITDDDVDERSVPGE